MDYVRYIREKVGNIPINLTGTNLIVLNEKEEILLQKRGTFPYKWGLLGGIVELGESLEECVIREAKEEANIEVKNLKLLGTTSGKDCKVTFPNGDETYFISIIFYTKDYIGEIKADKKETLELKFFNYNNLPDNIAKTHREAIEKYFKKQRRVTE
ncbi:MAG: hypothetical protein PWP46_1859 [Fusobacteriaceae bacterium]|nr:hypothetical protein [Fusobacteriaceae bacterium]